MVKILTLGEIFRLKFGKMILYKYSGLGLFCKLSGKLNLIHINRKLIIVGIISLVILAIVNNII